LKLATVAAPIVRLALVEDTGSGDITSEAILDEKTECGAAIVCRCRGVVAGLEIARLAFTETDKEVRFKVLLPDGSPVGEGATVAKVLGKARSILRAERVALNFLQRLSGIATRTSEYVRALEGTKTKVLDTRKTTPGLRVLEKYAVAVGGGVNHRFGLFDMYLIKDNHVELSGGAVRAIEKVKKHGLKVPIVCEASRVSEVREICRAGVDRILLDNMSLEEIRSSVELVRKATRPGQRIEIEASGGITLRNVREIALAGVDYVSIGELTHSIKSLDFSLEVVSVG